MDAMKLLHSRNSAPRLKAPAPQGEVLHSILKAGMRAPDHALLKPWRFLTIAGTGRDALGELFVRSRQYHLERAGDAALTDSEASKIVAKTMRAPLIVVVIASLTDHSKVPPIEQRLSAGCAAHGILLAAQACGFGGIWRTGDNAFDNVVMAGLGLKANESIIGFVYLGTIDGEPKLLREVLVEDYCQSWPLTQ